MIESEEDGNGDKSDGYKWKVKDENSPPSGMFDECAANDGSCNGSYRPLHTDESKPLPSLPQRHHVRHDDICQRNHAAAADTLKRTAHEQRGEIVGRGTNYRAEGEEADGDEQHRLTADDVG